MRGNAQRVGWAPTLGECGADGPTKDEMPDAQQVNCARSPMSQLIIADTNMLAVAASGAWCVNQMMGMRRKLVLFPEILETE